MSSVKARLERMEKSILANNTQKIVWFDDRLNDDELAVLKQLKRFAPHGSDSNAPRRVASAQQIYSQMYPDLGPWDAEHMETDHYNAFLDVLCSVMNKHPENDQLLIIIRLVGSHPKKVKAVT